ncbi:MAG: S8 family serine peptidase [Tenuifilaceae bacterium]
MKKSFVFNFVWITTILIVCFSHSMIYGQKRSLKTEILVFIEADSLDLPYHEKGMIPIKQAIFRSSGLKLAFEKAKVVGIGRAFPNWSNRDSLVKREDGKLIQAPPFHRVFTLTFSSERELDDAIERLSKLPSVVYAEKNSEPTFDNDPYYTDGTLWHLKNDGRNGGFAGADINAEGAWSIFTGSANCIIAIIDQGVDMNHVEFTGKITGDPYTGSWHGTEVAGVAAGNAMNGVGLRGVDWNARILSKKTTNSSGTWLGDAAVAQKITDAVTEGANVLNNSWSFDTYSTTLAIAFSYAYKMNRVTVATMGNTYGVQTRYPAGFSNVIAVGATQNNDVRSPFSTTGNHIDVVAPGGLDTSRTNGRNIFTTIPSNSYTFTSGTSFSAPQVTGLASLLKGFNSSLYNDDIVQIIRLSASKVSAMNGQDFTSEYGYGRINAGNALNMLLQPNQIKQWSTTGGNVVGSSSTYTAALVGITGLVSGNYVVKRHEVRKIVTFPESFCNITGAWGRGVGSIGWNMDSRFYGEGFCEVFPGSLTNTGVTLRTYVYEVWTMLGSYLGYYPTTPSNATFAYTVLGVSLPTITGPDFICNNDATISLYNIPSGSTVNWLKSDNITFTSSQTNSVTAKAINSSVSGIGWVQANIEIVTIGTCPVKKDVWVGAPVVTHITGSQHAGAAQVEEIYYANPYYSLAAASYSWQVSPSYYTLWSSGNEAGISFPYDGDYWVSVNAQNTCGTSSDAQLFVAVGIYEPYSIFPNPSDDFFTITLTDNKVQEASSVSNAKAAFDLSSNASYSVNILNSMGMPVFSTKSAGTSFSIPTSNLKDGSYIVVVDDGKKSFRKHLIVKH